MGYALVIDADVRGRHEKWFDNKPEAVAAWQAARSSGRNYSATLWDTTHSCVKLADFDRGCERVLEPTP